MAIPTLLSNVEKATFPYRVLQASWGSGCKISDLGAGFQIWVQNSVLGADLLSTRATQQSQIITCKQFAKLSNILMATTAKIKTGKPHSKIETIRSETMKPKQEF